MIACANRKLSAFFEPEPKPELQPIPFGPELLAWYERYSVTFKSRFQETNGAIIKNHLVPFFGNRSTNLAA
ncbi:MAG: hypothetical protein K8E66_03300, partial [Phycisphaerales bacterium]|nr:hypothetical protein [Phycisphaerales bacterium]